MFLAHAGHSHSDKVSPFELIVLAIGILLLCSLLAVRFMRGRITRSSIGIFLEKLPDIGEQLHKNRLKLLAPPGLAVIALVAYAIYKSHGIDVLTPRGTVADQERDLIIFTTALGMLVIIPVFIMTFWFAWKYRAGNKKADYKPEWDSNRKLEAIWWGVPLVIIIILAGITWKTSYSLDPFKPLESAKEPLNVQVIALEWKWLFLYPDQGVASINYVQFPEDRPVNFQITADAPMNSFWIPQLGGQIYAMSGMSTKLHLMADNPGVYDGSSANLSGEGFSGMKFQAESVSEEDFNRWVESARNAQNLDMSRYTEVAKQSKDNPPELFSLADRSLYDTVIAKYMDPGVHAQYDTSLKENTQKNEHGSH